MTQKIINAVWVAICLLIIGGAAWLYLGRYLENRAEDRRVYGVHANESVDARMKRWRQEAEAAVPRACTNAVGWRRTIRTQAFVFEGDIRKWSGLAEVEFINKVGGVERTNLPFAFSVGMADEKGLTHVYAGLDERR